MNDDKTMCTLQSRVYFKPTDTHQLLHKESFHPKHTTKGILKSQLIRFKRLSSTYDDYFSTAKLLFHSLTDRGYTFTELWKLFKEIWFQYTDNNRENDKNVNLLPIVIPYNSVGSSLGRKYKNIINIDTELKLYKSVIVYCNHKNLRSLLVSSKLTNINSNTTGQTKNNQAAIINRTRTLGEEGFSLCNEQRCITCKLHATTTNTFRSSRYNTTFNLTQNLNCKSTNIIYLITCKQCNIQYVGETSRSLAARFTDHRSNINIK